LHFVYYSAILFSRARGERKRLLLARQVKQKKQVKK
jgi:hypothetical protein